MRNNSSKSLSSIDRVDRKIQRRQKAEQKQRSRFDENEDSPIRVNKKILRSNDIELDDSFADF